MMKKSYKQFLLVIDWLHPLPEGHRDGYNFELFDTVEEMKARVEELMKFKADKDYPEGWNTPGRAHHVVALKNVGQITEKDKYGTAVIYEEFAVCWSKFDGWCLKEWATKEEWESKGSACDKLEAYFRNSDDKLLSVGFGWDTYEAIKESKQKKAVC